MCKIWAVNIKRFFKFDYNPNEVVPTTVGWNEPSLTLPRVITREHSVTRVGMLEI